ncbi:MAG: type VI secretion system baseplate subunit TssG [Myxococcota bacterium]
MTAERSAYDGVEFFQLVRRLQRERPARRAVGHASEPADEAVRFASATDLAFAARDVQRVEVADDGPVRVEVGFLGVASPHSFGSLPAPYVEEVHRRASARSTALRDFLDVFNHRLVSLFYRAWERSRIDVAHERAPDNAFRAVLRAVLGLEGPGLAERVPVDDRELLGRAGLLAMRPAPAAALEGALASLFDLDVEVVPFSPCWFEIDPEDRARLGVANATLGSDAALGSSVCLVDARFRIRIGPMDWERYRSLLPGSEGFTALVSVVRLAVGNELDFDVCLVLDGASVPPLVLRGRGEQAPRLGHATWLRREPAAEPVDQAIFHATAARLDGARGARRAAGGAPR